MRWQPRAGEAYVKLRRISKKASGATDSGALTVPSALMRRLVVGDIYKVEVTDEGILYRYIGTHMPDLDDLPTEPPPWLIPESER